MLKTFKKSDETLNAGTCGVCRMPEMIFLRKEIGRIRISNIFVTRKLSICIRISNSQCLIFEYLNIFVLHWNIIHVRVVKMK